MSTYQITIDGDKATHDSIKVLSHMSAYDKTLENVNLIAEQATCVIRFNYTKDNLQPDSIIEDLKSHIKEKNRDKVTFLIYKVWQEASENIKYSDVSNLVNASNEMGLTPILPTCGLCYADKKNFDCVFPNGKVGKCDNESPLIAKGIMTDGEIKWENNIEAHINAFRNDRFPCRECKYVPICWGPCVAKRALSLQDGNSFSCCFFDKEKEMHTYIINQCLNIKRLQSKK